MAPRAAPIAVAATYHTPQTSTRKINEAKSTTVAVKEAIWERFKETINEGREARRMAAKIRAGNRRHGGRSDRMAMRHSTIFRLRS